MLVARELVRDRWRKIKNDRLGNVAAEYEWEILFELIQMINISAEIWLVK